MRTTLVIDDALYRRVKIRAAETGKTVSETVNELLLSGLEPAKSTTPADWTFPSFGGPYPPVALSVEEIKRLDQELADPWMRKLVGDADS